MEVKKIDTKQILNTGFKHTHAGQYELGKIMLSVGIEHAKVFIENRFLMDIEYIEELHHVFFAIEGTPLKLKSETIACS